MIKKYYTELLLIVMINVFIVSCNHSENNENIIVHSNNILPSNPNLHIEIKKIFHLPENFQYKENTYLLLKNPFEYYNDLYFYRICQDIRGNVYVLNSNNDILKFNNVGEYLYSFGGRGNGPGKIPDLVNSLIVKQDTINVLCSNTPKIIRFDMEGNFIDDKILVQNNRPGSFIVLDKVNKILSRYEKFDPSPIKIESSIVLSDISFNNRVTLYQVSHGLEEYYSKLLWRYTSYAFNQNDSLVYVYQKSIDNYEIKLYNLNGKYVSKITKPYRKIEISAEKINQNKRSESLRDIKYHFSIYFMFVDFKGRLWVNRSTDRKDINKSEIFDIFENGIYINTIVLDFDVLNDDEINLITYDKGFFILNFTQNSISKYEIL